MAMGRSSNVSTSAGAPTRDSPMSAPSRAMSVDRSSGDGSVRVRSAPWAIRPGTTPASTSTMSMPAAGGCDSRSSRMSVRSTRASRMGAGRWRTRTCDSRVTNCNRVVTSTAPRSARSSATDNGSSTRASTNDNGSSPSTGQSSTQRSMNLGASSTGTSHAVSSPRAAWCRRTPGAPNRVCTSARGRRATSPSVRNPQRSSVASRSNTAVCALSAWRDDRPPILPRGVDETSDGPGAIR